MRSLRAAVNSSDSLSGWISLNDGLPRALAEWPGGVTVTGSHLASLASLHTGEADIASIDTVTLALVGDWRPEDLEGLSVLGHGPRVPSLPLVTAADDDDVVRALRGSITAAVACPVGRAAADVLRIERFHPLELADYLALLPDRDRAPHARGEWPLAPRALDC